MPTSIVKLNGTLQLGDETTGISLAGQISNFGMPQTVTRDSPVQVLDGTIVQPFASYSWALSGTVLLDLDNPDGAWAYINEHQGETSPFTFSPGGTKLTLTGTCTIDGVGMDDTDAGKLMTGKFTWPISGDFTPTWTP